MFKRYDIRISKDDKIFNRNFKKGLRELLDDCNLRYKEVGGRTLRRDAKSFRSTYISWSLIRGEKHEVIRRNVGTSIGVIQEFYSKHIQIESYRKQLTELDDTQNLYQV